MATTVQYREMGTGEIAVYSHKKFWFFTWWHLEYVLNYPMYETEGKLNGHVSEMQRLYEKHSAQFDAVLDAKALIKNSSQVDPYRSDPKEMELPKDRKKFLKPRARPSALWEGVRKAVMKARPNRQAKDLSPTEKCDDDEGSTELTGLRQQPIGKPVRDRQQQGKQQRRGQQQ